MLAVSRCFGDIAAKAEEQDPSSPRLRRSSSGRNLSLSLKSSPILSTPHVKTVLIEEHDDFLVICSDGFLDVVTGQELVDLVRSTLVETVGDLDKTISIVCKIAQRDWGVLDNSTLVVVVFHLQDNGCS